MSHWLKAGLIGAGVAVVLNLLAFIPFVACLTLIPTLMLFGCVGALAVYWMPTVRTTGQAAAHGALAGVITGVVDGVVGTLVAIASSAFWGPQMGLSQLPPEAIRDLHQAGIDPAQLQLVMGVGGAATCGTVCAGISIALAAGLGALGGVIYAALKAE